MQKLKLLAKTLSPHVIADTLMRGLNGNRVIEVTSADDEVLVLTRNAPDGEFSSTYVLKPDGSVLNASGGSAGNKLIQTLEDAVPVSIVEIIEGFYASNTQELASVYRKSLNLLEQGERKARLGKNTQDEIVGVGKGILSDDDFRDDKYILSSKELPVEAGLLSDEVWEEKKIETGLSDWFYEDVYSDIESLYGR